jgi:hypothetical protein
MPDKEKQKKRRAALNKALHDNKVSRAKSDNEKVRDTAHRTGRLAMKSSLRNTGATTRSRNDDQERGANLKKVKVKVKAASTKKASPVKSGKLGSGKAPKRNVLVRRTGSKTVKIKGAAGGERTKKVKHTSQWSEDARERETQKGTTARSVTKTRKRKGEHGRSIDKTKTKENPNMISPNRFGKVVDKKKVRTFSDKRKRTVIKKEGKKRTVTVKTPKKTVTRSGSGRRVVRK